MKHSHRVAPPGPALPLTVVCGVLCPLGLSGALAWDVLTRGYALWDVSLLQFLHQHATPAGDTVMATVSRIGGLHAMTLLIAALLGLLLIARRPWDAVFFLLAVGGALVLNLAVKGGMHHLHPGFEALPVPGQGCGFPSGHATGPTATATPLAILAYALALADDPAR